MKLILSTVAASLLLLISLSTCSASLAQFAGDWSNVDPNSGGITKLRIAISGASANVHAWGKCHPTDCDWGGVNAFAFAPDVSSDPVSQAQALMATYVTSFSETTLFISPQGSRLSVQSYTRFTDGSGRSNYGSSDLFGKSTSISAVGSIAEIQPIKKYELQEILPIRKIIA
ncbi:MAG: hypothetical protein A4E49_02788 [Methanosaeta sp. PtaU1.Bin112]|nr:MAG: hypothetical protein A4E49_02788 [Methanosaeta sp. PtaU1.Bin112]